MVSRGYLLYLYLIQNIFWEKTREAAYLGVERVRRLLLFCLVFCPLFCLVLLVIVEIDPFGFVQGTHSSVVLFLHLIKLLLFFSLAHRCDKGRGEGGDVRRR